MSQQLRMPYPVQPTFDSAVVYTHGPDSIQKVGVRPGRTVEFTLQSHRFFPHASHKISIHVPHGIDETETRVTVFQDGAMYLDPAGEVRGGIVLDNLSAAQQVPSMVGVFVEPAEGLRNAEYDAFNRDYATFVADEVLPAAQDALRAALILDDVAIVGGSSGGNCAVTACWFRRDTFKRAVSFLGSFAQIPGGNPFPNEIRQTSHAFRVFMQIGNHDLNSREPRMNWFAENMRVAAAFAEAGYPLRVVLGDGGHDPNHGGVLLPHALRWVWGDLPAVPCENADPA
ncbi:enterobactin/ferric enterobactin esterase [Microbacterium azadirachtae]|uniref:Enterobactin/ferric enterobactin esterase n=1 Tax=Microbacterium azadirachtae TaxID=582680 RepID=A0A0F0KSK6_9MICO|nr:alpha/beta hydrolase-fold protein [Microbacterium azadirachtae]KJL23887.1 enterobactin/ferric enterobactin esterase [Microbacterium azadirachtae]